jgi:hypothetical protein
MFHKNEVFLHFSVVKSSSTITMKPVYFTEGLNSDSDFQNTLNFIYDSVVDTRYVMYSSFNNFLKYSNVIDTVTPCTYLDTFKTLDAVELCPNINEPIEIKPLSGLKLAEIYGNLKNQRLQFFEFMILRSALQSEGYHPGCFKYLSMFLSNSTYLKFPI